MEIVRELAIEGEAARSLLLNIRDILGDDEQALADAIEGETNLNEIISKAVDRLAEIDAMSEAIKLREKTLKDRRDRLDRQAEGIRAAIIAAMGHAQLKKLELPQATLSLKPVPPKAIVTNEADIPAEFWKRQDPKLDMRALLAALKDEQKIPGATLSNGSETVMIRWS